MELFFGTLIIIIVCCAAMALGPVLSGKPLPGGCGKKLPGSDRCAGCSGRVDRKTCKRSS